MRGDCLKRSIVMIESGVKCKAPNYVIKSCARKQRLATASRQMQHTCQACQKVNSHAS